MNHREAEQTQQDRADAVDAVVRSLAHTPIPEGLEARILHRLEARRTQAPEPLSWFLPGLRRACVVAAAVAILSIGWRISRQPIGQHLSQTPAPISAETASAAPVPASSPRPMLRPTAPSTPAPPSRKVRRSPATRQPSFPAPEAPLTHQEQLLLSIAHVHQAEVIDALDPVRRAAADAEDDRQFKAYVATVHHGGF